MNKRQTWKQIKAKQKEKNVLPSPSLPSLSLSQKDKKNTGQRSALSRSYALKALKGQGRLPREKETGEKINPLHLGNFPYASRATRRESRGLFRLRWEKFPLKLGRSFKRQICHFNLTPSIIHIIISYWKRCGDGWYMDIVSIILYSYYVPLRKREGRYFAWK